MWCFYKHLHMAAISLTCNTAAGSRAMRILVTVGAVWERNWPQAPVTPSPAGLRNEALQQMLICWSHPSSYVLTSGYLRAVTDNHLHASHSYILPHRALGSRFASSRFAISTSPLCFVKVALNTVTEIDVFLGDHVSHSPGSCWVLLSWAPPWALLR